MKLPKSGDRIANYLLDTLVGTGSFGQVWKAHHFLPAVKQTVAIKIPTDPQYVRQLQREGLATFGLNHANIVRPLDLDPYADPPYLVMEYVEGSSLRAVIDHHPAGLAVESAVAIFRAMLEALRAAHAVRVIHGDVKPGNVLMATSADAAAFSPDQVKLTDFGLARVRGNVLASVMQSCSLEDEAQRRFGGTLAYMAPEQRDLGTADERSDLYSAGVVLFEMLTGVRPQGGDLPSQVRPGLPVCLDEIFRNCYTSPERRYESAQRLLTELTRATRSSDRHARTSCPRCGGTVEAEDQFCIHCGQQLMDGIPRCPACQGYVRAQDSYCIFCGAELRPAAQHH
ncbi:MAG: protein kinase [Phycisphaerales bacterium]|nr:MAG: protein kinase [Phycisphaerales bacterium]